VAKATRPGVVFRVMLMGAMTEDGREDRPDLDDVVPVFGTWKAIYTAVVASAVVVMVLLALFSRWPW
jgi:hypothetical protein